jgi:Protein of unknown function (DUF1214)/Protein of unknown function (DUF1254)
VMQMEPWLARDKLMIDMLKSIGIEKGKPFNPDPQTEVILKSAAREAHALLEVRYEGMFRPYFDISRWALPAMPDYLKASSDGFSDPAAYPFDSRGLAFTFVFFTPKHLGQGQSYLMTLEDKDGQNLDGSKSYRLTVPANAPVSQYWSATVYDRATHGLIREMPRSGRGSQSPGLGKEHGRLGGPLFRTESSGRQRLELGADEPERTVRGAVPPLWSRETAVRQDVGAAGHRADRCSVSEESEAMNNLRVQMCAGLLLAATIQLAPAQAQPTPQAPGDSALPVTVDNFNRAESEMYLGATVNNGGFGKFVHLRELYAIDAPVVRPNRDTLYSFSVFDLDAGSVTIMLPNAGQRFMSLQVIDGEQYSQEVHYGAGRYPFTREKIGTRYVTLGVRILVDPTDPEDIKQVHVLQDAITVEQPGGPGRFEVPHWDQASQKKVRDALLVLGATLPIQSACSAPGIRSIRYDT